MSTPPAPSPARFDLLDAARLVAILLMLQGHTLEAFVAPSAMDWTRLRWELWGQLRGLTAPLFLLISGAAAVLATRRGPDGQVPRALLGRRLRTALKVLAIGYLLVFPAAHLADLRWVSPAGWQAFLQVNILQLNAVALLGLTALLALTRSARTQGAWSLGLGLAILLAAPWVAILPWFAWLPEGLAAYLSYAHGSLFPIFPSAAFMFLGATLGAGLLESPGPERLGRFRLAVLGAGLTCLAFSLVAPHLPEPPLPPLEAYQAGWGPVFHRLGFAFLALGVLAALAQAWPGATRALAPLGRKSLAIYVVHLALIYGTPWTPGLMGPALHSLGGTQGVRLVPLVALATFAVVLAWDRLRNASSRIRALAHATAACALGYALLF